MKVWNTISRSSIYTKHLKKPVATARATGTKNFDIEGNCEGQHRKRAA